MQAFLDQDARHQRRDPEAERRDVARTELHRRAPRDHLLDAERLGLQGGEIDARLARERRIVAGLGRLHLIRIDHDDVDQRAGHVDLAGRDRARRLEAPDLRDHEAAGVARRERQIERAERRRLLGHRDVAAGIGGGAADDRHVRRDRPNVQPLLAVELDDADDVLAGRAVHPAAAPARVDEGVEADLGQHPCPARGRVAQEIENQPARQVVGLDRVLQDQPPDRRHGQRRRAARIAAGDHPLEQARPGQMIDPGDPVHVAAADRVQRGQIPRPAVPREALPERAQHAIRRVEAARAADRHDRPVRNQARRIVRTHCLRQRQPHLHEPSPPRIMARIGPRGDPRLARSAKGRILEGA